MVDAVELRARILCDMARTCAINTEIKHTYIQVGPDQYFPFLSFKSFSLP